MKQVSVIVFTMKGCPYCTQLKDMLNDEGIMDYYDRDIDEYKNEFDLFCELTNSDSVPALLIIEGTIGNQESHLYVPERDFYELSEAVELVKKHLL